MVIWLGIDFGKKRIGLALSDPGESISTPAETIEASGTVSEDVQRVLRWAARNDVAGFVVGRPLNMDGSVGRQARITDLFAERLREAAGMPVELWDERLSSYQADEYLDQTALSPTKRKQLRDALAAHVILQSFLDARRSDKPANESP